MPLPGLALFNTNNKCNAKKHKKQQTCNTPRGGHLHNTFSSMICCSSTASIQAKHHYLKGMWVHVRSLCGLSHLSVNVAKIYHRQLTALSVALEFYESLQQAEILDLCQYWLSPEMIDEPEPYGNANDSVQLVYAQVQSYLSHDPKPVQLAILKDLEFIQALGYNSFFLTFFTLRQGQELLTVPKSENGAPGQVPGVPITINYN